MKMKKEFLDFDYYMWIDSISCICSSHFLFRTIHLYILLLTCFCSIDVIKKSRYLLFPFFLTLQKNTKIYFNNLLSSSHFQKCSHHLQQIRRIIIIKIIIIIIIIIPLKLFSVIQLPSSHSETNSIQSNSKLLLFYYTRTRVS